MNLNLLHDEMIPIIRNPTTKLRYYQLLDPKNCTFKYLLNAFKNILR